MVQVRDLLPREHVFVPLEGLTLREAMTHMVRNLAQQGAVKDPASLEERIANEPIRDIVALSSRVVLPHYRTRGVDSVTMALGIAPEPLNAKEAGLDARPRLVILLLAPSDSPSLYLQTLASLARLLQQEAVVDTLVSQTSADGVLTLDALTDLKIQPALTVRDIMLHRTESLPPEAPVREAVNLMVRRRIHALPVVGEKGEVLGMVTDRDIMSALMPLPRLDDAEEHQTIPGNLSVRDIMSRSVLCVSEELGLSEAATMMVNKDIEQLPVVSGGALTGVITRAEIIRKLFGP
jgi:CBS domain-containing protein/mannitol/fructose-specific phosphotransferase system IIA component (Ntr-type)